MYTGKHAYLRPLQPAFIMASTGETVTYRELDERSNQLAHFLQARGVKKGDRVGLYSSKCPELVAAMFGIVKAGAVYVPLDPQAPIERISYIIGNCGIKGLITSKERLPGLDPAAILSVSFAVLVDSDSQDANHVGWNELSKFPAATAPQSY